MRTREEQLEAWKTKRSKPLSAIGNSNTGAINRPPKPPAKQAAALNADIKTNQTQEASGADKENQREQPSGKAPVVVRTGFSNRLPRFKQSADKAAISKPAPKSKPEAQLLRKTALPAAALENMENQYDLLKGTLDTLKRESIRYWVPATAAYHMAKMPFTALRLQTLPAGPASVATPAKQAILRCWDPTMLLILTSQGPACQEQLMP